MVISQFRNMCSVIRVTIPAYIEDAEIRLRQLRLSDGLFMINGLKDEIILNSCGVSGPINSSWFSLWWWLKRTFMPAYCIEIDSKPIGFIGLYDLVLGESAEISLAIFDKTFRRKGYGTRAFNLLVRHMKRHSVVKEIQAKIIRGNHHAISFWRRVGFLQLNTPNDTIISMSMDLVLVRGERETQLRVSV